MSPVSKTQLLKCSVLFLQSLYKVWGRACCVRQAELNSKFSFIAGLQKNKQKLGYTWTKQTGRQAEQQQGMRENATLDRRKQGA